VADWLADAGPLAEAGLAVAKLCWGIVGKAMEALSQTLQADMLCSFAGGFI